MGAYGVWKIIAQNLKFKSRKIETNPNFLFFWCATIVYQLETLNHERKCV